ncbi:hypothetical protein [Rhodohalobacter mucosus]|nr:hypothetical protein [Rhodohalobacter mucosus]
MKKVFPILLVALIAASCASSQKMLQRGQYDRAIDKASEKLMKKPDNGKELAVLKEAYELANTFDQERIDFLELEGLEESWVEIYLLYEEMNIRQNKVRRLPSQVRSQFTFVNYDQKIVDSKAAAADVSYRRGEEFLAAGDKLSARQAYNEFEQADLIYPGYRDVVQKMAEAEIAGRNNALFLIENNSGMVVPEFFDSEIKKVTLKELNTLWLNIDTYENESIDYDHFVILNITDISFSPETIERRTFTESREIQDGMRYQLDDNGNVMKDSTGTDIRVPNMITVSAEITETVQLKSAVVGGSLNVYDLRTDQLVKTDNIGVEAVFRHRFGEYSGDRRALSEELQAVMRGREVPFPANEEMMMDAAELLKDRSKAIVARNRRVLES